MRVSTAGQADLLIFNALANQERVVEQQTKIATGKISDDFAGLADRAQSVLTSRSLLTRTESFRDAVRAARLQLDANDAAMTAVLDTARDIRENVLNAIALGDATGLQEALQTGYEQIAGALNTELNGEFLFAGTRTDTRPVAFDSLADLQASGVVADAFTNDQVAPRAQVTENIQVTTGLLASDVASDLFQSILDLANSGLTGDLTPADVTFLQTELQNLDAGIATAQQAQISNGLGFQQLDVVDEQLSESAVFLEIFVGELEDADIAEAVTELNQDQLALQTSFQSIALLNNLTLLNFL